MLQQIKKLYHGIVSLSELANGMNKVDSRLYNIGLSPIERYISLNYFYRRSGLFHFSYEEWRIRRINKILELYGIDYFKNRNICELGSGHGDIGAFFAELGANVLCLDGRIQNVNLANLKYRELGNFKCKHFNLENDFSHFGKFDLILNFGLIYHLKNVDSHLNCCFKMADDVLLESVVCDSTDPDKIFFCDENRDVDEEAVEGTGSRPSPFYIEKIAKENNFEVVRYFSEDLNSGDLFFYDWEHKNDNRLGDGFKLRRFWRFKK